MSLGWECPKCGQCYAPFVQMCGNCVPKAISTDGSNIVYATICNCAQHKPGESTGGWYCPVHGQQL